VRPDTLLLLLSTGSVARSCGLRCAGLLSRSTSSMAGFFPPPLPVTVLEFLNLSSNLTPPVARMGMLSVIFLLRWHVRKCFKGLCQGLTHRAFPSEGVICLCDPNSAVKRMGFMLTTICRLLYFLARELGPSVPNLLQSLSRCFSPPPPFFF